MSKTVRRIEVSYVSRTVCEIRSVTKTTSRILGFTVKEGSKWLALPTFWMELAPKTFAKKGEAIDYLNGQTLAKAA